MAIPKWMHETPASVCHPASTLRHAAKALRAEAAELHHLNRSDANAARHFANCFDAVANGESWAKAFDLGVK